MKSRTPRNEGPGAAVGPRKELQETEDLYKKVDAKMKEAILVGAAKTSNIEG